MLLALGPETLWSVIVPRNDNRVLPLSHAMRIERMTVIGGDFSVTPYEVEVEWLGAGAGKVRGFDCNGFGKLAIFLRATFRAALTPAARAAASSGVSV